MPHAWLSSRVSSGPQARRGGHRRQEDASAVAAALRWCERHGYELQGTLRFTGSAYKGRHMAAGAPQREWLERAIRGALGPRPALLIEQIDRLTRQAGHVAEGGLAELLYRAFPAGVVLADLGEGVTYSTEEFERDDRLLGELIEEARLAHRESARKARRLLAHWQQVEQDLLAGRPRRGRHVAPWWIDAQGGRWELNEHAPLARRIFALALQQGCMAIACDLNTEGAATPGRRQGSAWTAAAVCSILRNPAAWGAYRGHPGVFPALLSREEWEVVQARTRERISGPRAKGRREQVRWIGAGLTRCTCGWTAGVARVTRAKGRLYRYVGCTRRADHGPRCHAPMVPIADATAHLLTRLTHGQLAALAQAPGRDARLVAVQERYRTAQEALSLAEQRQEHAAEAVRAAVLRGQEHELLLSIANEARAAAGAARTAAAEAGAALEEAQRDAPTGSVEQAAAELLQAVAEGRDTPQQRRALRDGLADLGVRLTLAADRRAMGLAIGDGEVDWQPIDPAQRRYLAEGRAGVRTRERLGEVAIQHGDWVELLIEPDRR
ncbi:MAG: recombinase family protein [Cyanobacteria bacterium J06638_7]